MRHNIARIVTSGLIVSCRQPYIACSPDGVYTDSDGSLVFLEIKFLFSCEDMSRNDGFVNKKLLFLGGSQSCVI